MSGYGMPQGAAPGPARSGRNMPALPVLELVGVGLAVLAFIVAFLPWAKVEVPGGADIDGVNPKGWDLPLPTAGVVMLLVAALLVAAPLLTRRAVDDEAVSPVPALVAALGALLLLVFAIIGYGDLKRGLGSWLGLVLGLGTAAVLVLSWMQRTGRVKKPSPAAGPSNWNQGQPQQQQGWGGQPYQQPYEQQPPAYEQQPPAYEQPPAAYGQGQAQPPAYPQQPSYGGQGGYPGPSTGGQPAQQPGPYGQEQYPPQSGQYPAQGGYHPQG